MRAERMTAKIELLLIRGLPGSGKTTMAKKYAEATGNWPNVHGVPTSAIEKMRARWEPVEEGNGND